MTYIEILAEWNLIDDYFFSYVKQSNMILSDMKYINLPYQYLIILKKSFLKDELLTPGLKISKSLW